MKLKLLSTLQRFKSAFSSKKMLLRFGATVLLLIGFSTAVNFTPFAQHVNADEIFVIDSPFTVSQPVTYLPDCLQKRIDWLESGQRRQVDVKLVMLTQDNRWASYADGSLSYKSDTSISGYLTQYFSDRKTDVPGTDLRLPNQPFSILETERRVLEIYQPSDQIISTIGSANTGIRFYFTGEGSEDLYFDQCYGDIAILHTSGNTVMLSFKNVQLEPPVAN